MTQQLNAFFITILALVMSACAYHPPRQDSMVIIDDTANYPSDSDIIDREPMVDDQQEYNINREAVASLVDKAEWHARAGEFKKAESIIERAMRIQPNDANLWYRLGKMKLAQGQPYEAEQFAQKSISLAGRDASQVAASWRLIGNARQSIGDDQGAAEAEAMAIGAMVH